jgi:hypothetical protein
MHIESEVDRGTVVTVVLPAERLLALSLQRAAAG